MLQCRQRSSLQCQRREHTSSLTLDPTAGSKISIALLCRLSFVGCAAIFALPATATLWERAHNAGAATQNMLGKSRARGVWINVHPATLSSVGSAASAAWHIQALLTRFLHLGAIDSDHFHCTLNKSGSEPSSSCWVHVSCPSGKAEAPVS